MRICRAVPIRMVSGWPRIASPWPSACGKGAPLGVGDRLDFQPLGIEDDLGRIGRRLDGQHRLAADPVRLEIERQIERDMGDAGDLRPREAMPVARLRLSQDRRHPPLAGRRRRRALIAAARGAGGEQGEESESEAAHGKSC